MKESVLMAVSWLKSNLYKFNLEKITSLTNKKTEPKNLFDCIDIHVHFPAASIKKDGPSAGITITTALVTF